MFGLDELNQGIASVTRSERLLCLKTCGVDKRDSDYQTITVLLEQFCVPDCLLDALWVLSVWALVITSPELRAALRSATRTCCARGERLSLSLTLSLSRSLSLSNQSFSQRRSSSSTATSRARSPSSCSRGRARVPSASSTYTYCEEAVHQPYRMVRRCLDSDSLHTLSISIKQTSPEPTRYDDYDGAFGHL